MASIKPAAILSKAFLVITFSTFFRISGSKGSLFCCSFPQPHARTATAAFKSCFDRDKRAHQDIGDAVSLPQFFGVSRYQRRIFRRDPERTTANALARLVYITPNGLFFFTGRLPLMLQHGARAVINSASILRASAKSFVHKFYLYFILPDAAHVLAPL